MSFRTISAFKCLLQFCIGGRERNRTEGGNDNILFRKDHSIDDRACSQNGCNQSEAFGLSTQPHGIWTSRRPVRCSIGNTHCRWIQDTRSQLSCPGQPHHVYRRPGRERCGVYLSGSCRVMTGYFNFYISSFIYQLLLHLQLSLQKEQCSCMVHSATILQQNLQEGVLMKQQVFYTHALRSKYVCA